MPEKDEYLYMDDGGHGCVVEMTPELEAKLEEIEKKVKDKFKDILE